MTVEYDRAGEPYLVDDEPLSAAETVELRHAVIALIAHRLQVPLSVVGLPVFCDGEAAAVTWSTHHPEPICGDYTRRAGNEYHRRRRARARRRR